MSNIQNPKTAFLSQLKAQPEIFFGKFNNTDAPLEQSKCVTCYLDTKSGLVAFFKDGNLIGKPEDVDFNEHNDEYVPEKDGVILKDQVVNSIRLPVYRSESYAFFLQKWTTSAGFLMVENEPFEPVDARSLMKQAAASVK